VYVRSINRYKDGKDHPYWAIVESYRTVRGPRQRVVAYLGEMDGRGRVAVEFSDGRPHAVQRSLWDDEPEWVEVDIRGIRVEHPRKFGGIWLALELSRRVGLSSLLRQLLPRGKEAVPWHVMAEALVACRFSHPGSELSIAERLVRHTALPELLGVPAERINDDRLYRSLDRLLPHKEALEGLIGSHFEGLLPCGYDVLFYDLTSTYFEGELKEHPLAKRGYSRDKRPDAKQVCVGLVVSHEGIPLCHEVFEGNRQDATTLQEMVQSIEARYGKAERIWVLDRGMINKRNLEFLQQQGRRYIVNAPRSTLRDFQAELEQGGWKPVADGVEAKLCRKPGTDEVFVLCRSELRAAKETAIEERFVWNIHTGLERLREACRTGRLKRPEVVQRRIGALLGHNSRVARQFQVEVTQCEHGGLDVIWHRRAERRQWAELTRGCYVLRAAIPESSAEALWQTYMQLTQAEKAFRIHKSDIRLRPIWHRRPDRIKAHILVCFLAYFLWSFLAQLCKRGGLGDEPRRIVEEIARLELVDVVLPTRSGLELRLQRVTEPDDHQKVLLHHLGLSPPRSLTTSAKM